MSKKVPFWEILKTLTLFIFAFAVVLFVAQTMNSLFIKKESDPFKGGSRTIVTCAPDFLSYTALTEKTDQVLKLIPERKTMFAENGDFVNSEVVIAKSETSDSKVACGYLFARTGTIDGGALRSWENLYINPNNFGGHINAQDQIGPGDGNNYSEYLFPLDRMSYWKNLTDRGRNVLSSADWAALLNVSKEVSFSIALNTEDKTGFIDELSIAYKCWNPATGEENTGCKLYITVQNDTKSNGLK